MDERFFVEAELIRLKKYRKTMFGKLTREEWQALKRQRAALREKLRWITGDFKVTVYFCPLAWEEK